MEAVNTEMDLLNQIKTAVTDDYLRVTSAADLRAKVDQIDEIVKKINHTWDTTSGDDIPDHATASWANKKMEASGLRDEIKGKLDARLKELDESEAQLDLKGAEAIKKLESDNPQKTPEEVVTDLNDLYKILKKDLENVSDTYLKEANKETLEKKREAIKEMHETWKNAYEKLDVGRLTMADGTKLQGQKSTLIRVVATVNNKISSQLLTLSVRDSQTWVEEQQAAKKKAEQDAQEAIDRALEEKRQKESAQKEQRQGRKGSTSVTELLEFLETRAMELQPSQGDRLSQLLKTDVCRRPPRKIFQINEPKKQSKQEQKPECPVCKGTHRICNCDKLKAECAKVRTDIIRSLKMCFKCLLKHQLGACEHEDCSYCGGPHHVLLCYKKENNQKKAQANPNSSQNFRNGPRRLEPAKREWSNPPRQAAPPPTRPPPVNDDWDDDWDAPAPATKNQAK